AGAVIILSVSGCAALAAGVIRRILPSVYVNVNIGSQTTPVTSAAGASTERFRETGSRSLPALHQTLAKITLNSWSEFQVCNVRLLVVIAVHTSTAGIAATQPLTEASARMRKA
ncbi:MAG: hypothetical protein WCA24_02030, partial [Thiomonas sp.]